MSHGPTTPSLHRIEPALPPNPTSFNQKIEFIVPEKEPFVIDRSVNFITSSTIMDDPSSDVNGSLPSDEDAIAYAAHAAAQAISESDAAAAAVGGVIDDTGVDDILRCRICGRGDEEGRPILRFLPVDHDVAAANAAPGVITFTEDISLHIFCGKTASILPNVNRPDLEILTKAGLKNKHGIGAEVNAALARTRCAILAEGTKEKHFYLVREFEAHLAAIRHTNISYIPEAHDAYTSHPPTDLLHHSVTLPDTHHHHTATPLAHPGSISFYETIPAPLDALEPTEPLISQPKKLIPVRAAAGQIQKVGRQRYSNTHHDHLQNNNVVPTTESSHDGEEEEDGVDQGDEVKVRCACGGSHLPTDTPRGNQSWQTHVLTKRHQKWLESQGMLGAV